MKTHTKLYSRIVSYENLLLVWQKARKGKTKKLYVTEFEKYLEMNLADLREELLSQNYCPRPLVTFVLRDPKTRKISKSDFRDRIVHHALCNIIEPLFERTFIYYSCANRKGKGTLFALQQFEKFRRKATQNFTTEAFCFKADIRHYFEEVDHDILLSILKKKIADEKTLWLIKQILKNSANSKTKRERE